MYRAVGSCAPIELFNNGPPGIPGNPRPALGETFPRFTGSALGLSRFVVEGVTRLAENLLVGAERGSIGEIVTGDRGSDGAPPGIV